MNEPPPAAASPWRPRWLPAHPARRTVGLLLLLATVTMCWGTALPYRYDRRGYSDNGWARITDSERSRAFWGLLVCLIGTLVLVTAVLTLFLAVYKETIVFAVVGGVLCSAAIFLTVLDWIEIAGSVYRLGPGPPVVIAGGMCGALAAIFAVRRRPEIDRQERGEPHSTEKS